MEWSAFTEIVYLRDFGISIVFHVWVLFCHYFCFRPMCLPMIRWSFETTRDFLRGHYVSIEGQFRKKRKIILLKNIRLRKRKERKFINKCIHQISTRKSPAKHTNMSPEITVLIYIWKINMYIFFISEYIKPKYFYFSDVQKH